MRLKGKKVNTQINTVILKEKIFLSGLSKMGFAKKCGISYQTLKKILSGTGNVKILSLFKIARTLNIHIHELFNKKFGK